MNDPQAALNRWHEQRTKLPGTADFTIPILAHCSGLLNGQNVRLKMKGDWGMRPEKPYAGVPLDARSFGR